MYAIKRSGFAMIMAIFIVVLVAMGGVVILSKASKGTKVLGDNYLHTQAELLAMSATEFAVLQIQGTDFNAGCLDDFNITVRDADNTDAYEIGVVMSYSFKGDNNFGCLTADVNNSAYDSAMIDVTVVADRNLTTEPIRVFKRSFERY